jgi:hypothetical protein
VRRDALYDIGDAVPRFIEELLPRLERPAIERLQRFIPLSYRSLDQ